MPTQALSLETIEEFLAQKRIALIGASRNPKSFSIMMFEELCRRGYDVVPVNPKTPNVLGRPCYAHVQDIQPPVQAALLITSPQATESAVADCAKAGIRRIWIHGASVRAEISPRVLAFCQDREIQVVAGQCPFMFLPSSGGVHRLHGLVRKISGRYPRRKSA